MLKNLLAVVNVIQTPSLQTIMKSLFKKEIQGAKRDADESSDKDDEPSASGQSPRKKLQRYRNYLPWI